MMSWLHITSGRGPEECCWVVSQLVQYIIDNASQYKLHTELLESIPGTSPGTLSSALLAVEGADDPTDFIKKWEGSVQWVGTSMFRPNHKRKNWFVSVEALEPLTREEWKTDDIRVERMRSSGPGGQHVNKTESAIRVTHVPTGLTAISQEERSQHLNKKLALARLEELLQLKESQNKIDFDQMRWGRHNSIERGNAVHVFEGKNFRLKK